MALSIILLNIACVSCFLLAFLSFLNPLKVNIIANRWFGVFLFSVASALLNRILDQGGHTNSYRQLTALNELSRYIIAPALYLSVLHYTSVNKIFRVTEYLHFLPFLIFFICTVSFVISSNHSIFNPSNFSEGFKVFAQVFIRLSIPVQLSVYWALSYYKLKQHESNIQIVASDMATVDLKWLRYLLWGIFFMIVISISGFLPGDFGDQITSAGYVIGVLFIAYYLMAQKEIYPFENQQLQELSVIVHPDIENIVKQRLSAKTIESLKVKLQNLMDTERVYQDSELSLPDLSRKMDISSHDLSYLLNEGFHMNFYEFVNSYRIAEAKRLILSGQHLHLNILGIAYNAGFNSKTTFNTTFKKVTGMAPSQFIKQLNADRPQDALK